MTTTAQLLETSPRVLQCQSCGREYALEPGETMTACPEVDDCPSHWEEIGKEHPDHPAVPA